MRYTAEDRLALDKFRAAQCGDGELQVIFRRFLFLAGFLRFRSNLRKPFSLWEVNWRILVPVIRLLEVTLQR